ncbi:DUF2141 domain-containing protein [Sphingomonas sp. ASY06-1R]|jgi:uncharacterized protein (DUF2141 family)|uniref:DUF2141 domain-containing protein n=1 Tax=Sphingomonas sp. ASY06-1R TaxID=3445771 RepID=UPI003FA21468
MKPWPLLLLLTAAAAPSEAPIEVDVSGVRSAQGLVRVMVCPKETFMKACPWSASTPAKVGQVTVVVHGVPPGHYAVQAYHDADSNDKLDQNWIGIPREGIGFSNDAMSHLTRPKFTVAAFDHGTVRQRIAVKIRYFLG